MFPLERQARSSPQRTIRVPERLKLTTGRHAGAIMVASL